MSKTIPSKNTKPRSNRANIYLRNPVLLQMLHMAVTQGLIEAKSGSERLEQMLTTEARRLLPKFKAAKVPIPAELIELLEGN